jgi:HEAT repeat protein
MTLRSPLQSERRLLLRRLSPRSRIVASAARQLLAAIVVRRFAKEVATLCTVEAGEEPDDVFRAAQNALRSMSAADLAALLPDPKLRNIGLYALGSNGGEAAPFAKEIVGLLADENGDSRWEAADALRGIDPEGATFAPAIACGLAGRARGGARPRDAGLARPPAPVGRRKCGDAADRYLARQAGYGADA